MLASNALIVQTIFLEADSTDVVSVEHMELLLELPTDQVETILRYVVPFMTKSQSRCVEKKLRDVANLTNRPIPEWLTILRRK